MSKTITVAVVGAGNRGAQAYGEFISKNPGDIKAVAVAEPDSRRRRSFAEEHRIPDNRRYADWNELLAEERLADGLIIATMDRMHVEPAVRAMARGYTILLEKPMAPTWEGMRRIAGEARKRDSIILLCHVLRYTSFYRKLKEVLDRGLIGEIRLVDHVENIGFFHFAHSYVRGNWRNTEEAAPIILAKTSHDLDILYWLLGSRAHELFSRGSLEYFTPEKRPEEAADRCLECVLGESCPYSARRIYLGEDTGWPTSVISSDLSYAGRFEALKKGPYGRCVFSCDNSVPDVQTVNMTLEDSTEVNFALTAFSREINRHTRFFGSNGEIMADFLRGTIEICRFGEDRVRIDVDEGSGGHGGGDSGLMRAFIRLIRGETDPGAELTTLDDSLESHIQAFAAESSRHSGKCQHLEDWRNRL